jgi:methylmalonyl-CoA/ethylmalonyl-CoA epimerase
MIERVNHIGIAVDSIEDAVKLYTEALGLELKGIEVVADQKVRIAIIPVGNTRIELLESTDPDGPIAKHIKTRGEGLHHLALQVDGIEGILEALEKKEIPLIDRKPRIGAEGAKIAFLHPKGTRALIELVQPAE